MASITVRHLIRVVLIASLLSLWFVANPERSYACSCVWPTIPDGFSNSNSVFAGRVVSVRELKRDDDNSWRMDLNMVEFEVKTVWKGYAYGTMYVTTASDGGACGYTFIEGKEYLIYSNDFSMFTNYQTVNYCSRTRRLSEAADDLAYLGAGHSPGTGTVAPTPNVRGYNTGSEPDVSGGGCGSRPSAADASVVAMAAGLMWFGLKRKRPHLLQKNEPAQPSQNSPQTKGSA